MSTAGFSLPAGRVTVSLAPADLPKESGRFDLPIAIGILAASGQVPMKALPGLEFAGELALSGELRPIRGALPMVLGKRVAPPAGTSVRIDVPDAGQSWSAAIGDDGRAAATEPLADPTVLITVSAEDFVVLAGGRRPLEATSPAYVGDAELGAAVLSSFAVTP